MEKSKEEIENKKWDFEDYAFTIATVLFAVPMIFGVFFADNMGLYDLHRWWPFSWMAFMLAWSVCAIKDLIDVKRGAKDADLKNSVEYALYINITTIILFIGIIRGEMYSSWLAGPIVFVLLMVIWPFLRNSKDKDQSHFLIIPLILLITGIVVEVLVGGWIAFPVSWILISLYMLQRTIRKSKFTEDVKIDIMYNAFSIIFISIGLIWGIWIVSWLAYPISIIISKIVAKTKYKHSEELG